MIALTTNTRGNTKMSTPDFKTMNGPQLVAAYNEMAAKAGIDPVKRFSNAAVGLRRCLDLAAKAAPVAPKATKVKAEKTKADGRISKFGSDIVLQIVAKENPRSKGTNAHKKWEEMVAFMAKNKSAKLVEVFAATSYQRKDYVWDLAKGSVK